MNKQISAAELKENIISFLKEHKQASLATCSDNRPRTSPVRYFLGDDLDIYIFSAGGDKFYNIQRNPNVCMLVNTEYINYRKIKGVQIFGKATVSDDNPALYDEAEKFSPDPYVFENERGSLKVIKIHPEEIVFLDSLKDRDRTKQVLKGDEVIIKEDKQKVPVV